MFKLPLFNLNCNIWRNGAWTPTSPPTAPPDVVSVCNLALGSRTWIEATVLDNQWLLLPWSTDIRDGIRENTNSPDLVEVPAGTGMWYVVDQVLFASTGFPTAHIAAIIGAGGGKAPPQSVPYWSGPFPQPPYPGILNSAGVGPSAANQTIVKVFPNSLIAVCFSAAGPGVTSCTLTSTLLGAISTFINNGGISQGASTSISGIFYFVHPGGMDTLTLTPNVPGVIQNVTYYIPGHTLDGVAGFSGGPGTVPFVPITNVTQLSETGVAMWQLASWTPNSTIVSPWSKTPAADILNLDSSAIAWGLGAAVQLNMNLGPITGSMTTGAGAFAGAKGAIAGWF